MENVHKFVKHEVPSLEQISNTPVYRLMQHLNNGGSYKSADRAEIEVVFNELFHSEAYRHGYVKRAGYVFDFSEYLKTYLIKCKHFGWYEVKAFNKTLLRKLSANPSYILKIIELN